MGSEVVKRRKSDLEDYLHIDLDEVVADRLMKFIAVPYMRQDGEFDLVTMTWDEFNHWKAQGCPIEALWAWDSPSANVH